MVHGSKMHSHTIFMKINAVSKTKLIQYNEKRAHDWLLFHLGNKT